MSGVLVTGAANGIGRSTAALLAVSGRPVVLADRDRARLDATAAELAAAAPDAVLSTVEVDVADPASVRAMFGAAGSPLAGLVHCAGIVGTTQLGETSLDEWNRIVAVNLTGTFLVVQEAVEHLLPGGSIVTLASLAAQTSSRFASPGYAASKAGVIGLTKSLAASLAGRALRINAIAPGAIDTGMLQEFGAERAASLKDANPMGRLGTPDEIASVAAFLVSDRSSFVTGQVLSANGGAFVG